MAIQPAMLDLQYTITGTHYLDLSYALSQCNRRGYDQGRNYFVSGVSFVFEPGVAVVNAEIKLQTAGNTWAVHNAWEKAFACWKEQQNLGVEECAALGIGSRGKWSDFKVYLDDHHRAASAAPYTSTDGDNVPVLAGEWVYSKLVYDDAGTARSPYLHLVGADVSTTDVGMVENYGDSRVYRAQTPILPAGASDTIFAKIHETQPGAFDDLIDDVETDNDFPPYDEDDYPGGAANADAPWMTRHVKVNAVQSSGFIPGFLAQCGLVLIKYSAEDAAGDAVGASPCQMIFHMSPGSYKGVQAEAMGQ